MTEPEKAQPGVTRRDFLKATSGVALGVVVGEALYRLIPLDNGLVAYAASEGYLLVDNKKCSGCRSCMLSCSLVHEGKENLSLARIQILEDSFGRFPDDLVQEQCKQCVYPACADSCPTRALHVDGKIGNVRTVDPNKCIGCMRCVEACPEQPARIQWNPDTSKSQKCDLCADAPFWNAEGGVNGKQACVEVCPMGAIAFTGQVPSQEWDVGYRVNLRGDSWAALGLPTD